jgi:hypothetical protein
VDKYFVTYFLVFVAWQICAIPLYRAEWKGIGIARGLLHASADERRAYSDGPIYPILKAAQELVPANHRVLFINPAIDAQRNYYWHKVNYYLWPRRVVFVKPSDVLDPQTVSEADAILLFDALGAPTESVAFLDGLPSFTKAFESSLERSNPTVYGFEPSHGRSYQAIYLRSR